MALPRAARAVCGLDLNPCSYCWRGCQAGGGEDKKGSTYSSEMWARSPHLPSPHFHRGPGGTERCPANHAGIAAMALNARMCTQLCPHRGLTAHVGAANAARLDPPPSSLPCAATVDPAAPGADVGGCAAVCPAGACGVRCRSFTCLACSQRFELAEDQRNHFKSDWHRCGGGGGAGVCSGGGPGAPPPPPPPLRPPRLVPASAFDLIPYPQCAGRWRGLC